MKLIAATLPILALGFVSISNLVAEPPPGGPRKEQGARGPLRELSQEEREKLRTALEAVKEDPAVVASREAVKAAAEQHKKTLRDAVLKKDPSLGPVLEKLGEAFPPRLHGREGVRPGEGKPKAKGKPEAKGKPNDKRKKDAEELMEAAPE